ncbi:MAG TPA: hypothetical protein VFE33_08600 [Thermoanaerobaculia bacterium]|nr:hypothetical protein [Thermoanaerobaculia bacterium]
MNGPSTVELEHRQALSRDNPWPGLDPFDEMDRKYFHGRSTESGELLRQVRRELLTVLFGRSGLGKTSLLKAGLFPLLRDEDYLPVYVRLDHDAGAPALREQIYREIQTACAADRVQASQPAGDEILWSFFHRRDVEFWSDKTRPVTPVIVLDQFEEIFTLGEETEAARVRSAAFLAELGDLVENRPPDAVRQALEAEPTAARRFDFRRSMVKLVLSFREDFLAEMEGLKEQMPSLMYNRFRLLAMSGSQAYEVITRAGGHLVDDEVARRILRLAWKNEPSPPVDPSDFSKIEIDPALLSVVCSELNHKRQQAKPPLERITPTLLEGADREILSGFYERGMAGLDPRVRAFVEDELITGRGYRDSHALEDALALTGVTAEALDALIRRRLVRVDERQSVRRLELTHDVLARVVKESRDSRRAREAEEAAKARERAALKQQRRNRLLASLVLGLPALILLWAFTRFTSDRPVDYEDDVAHFKHGSIGGERMTGIPYWLWVALPEVFPENLPDQTPNRGYSSFGMIYEKGEDPRYALPVGMSRRNVQGVEMVFLNCAVCHTGTVRDTRGAAQRVIPGMPANTFDIGAWSQFLTTSASNPKFTPQRLLAQIEVMEDDPRSLVGKPDRINWLIFRYTAFYGLQEQLLSLAQRMRFIDLKQWGPGREDTFGLNKAFFNFPMDHAEAEFNGYADFPSVWNQGPREGMQLSWDGNNTSVDERNLSALFGTGAYPPTLDADRVLRTSAWLKTKAKPPDYPYPVDRALAAQGASIYGHYCVGCHGTREAPYRHNPPQPGERVGTVVPIAKIGTDRHRLDSFTWLLSVNLGTNYAGFEKDWGYYKPYPQRFTHYRKTYGYANTPLDGLWLRAPYLHNGSVPSLRMLLEPAAARTRVFYSGNDVYDPENVGFVADLPQLNGRRFFPFDTTKPGNGNFGHEGPAYGTDLPPEQKRALIEYLKTF